MYTYTTSCRSYNPNHEGIYSGPYMATVRNHQTELSQRAILWMMLQETQPAIKSKNQKKTLCHEKTASLLKLAFNLPSGNQNNQIWLAGKSPMNGGFVKKITDKWYIFHCHVSLPEGSWQNPFCLAKSA